MLISRTALLGQLETRNVGHHVLKRAARLALQFLNNFNTPAMITSVCRDGATAHHDCMAVDLTTKQMVSDSRAGPLFVMPYYISMVKRLGRLLSIARLPVTVLLENDHIHIEYDRFKDGRVHVGFYDKSRDKERYWINFSF
jgi:hypothetical protein